MSYLLSIIGLLLVLFASDECMTRNSPPRGALLMLAVGLLLVATAVFVEVVQ